MPLERIVVVHDELDIDFAVLRLKRGGGDNGHNGLKSITKSLGPDYFRVRFGMRRPPGRMDVAAFVLKDFSSTERKGLDVEVDSGGGRRRGRCWSRTCARTGAGRSLQLVTAAAHWRRVCADSPDPRLRFAADRDSSFTRACLDGCRRVCGAAGATRRRSADPRGARCRGRAW
ncbi:aminoacyl-tRNA hydrolase [Yinghuangia aomiensis]